MEKRHYEVPQVEILDIETESIMSGSIDAVAPAGRTDYETEYQEWS